MLFDEGTRKDPFVILAVEERVRLRLAGHRVPDGGRVRDVTPRLHVEEASAPVSQERLVDEAHYIHAELEGLEENGEATGHEDAGGALDHALRIEQVVEDGGSADELEGIRIEIELLGVELHQLATLG